MIVKDEEESLPQCLSSVKDVVDEMVILDTGSTDRTIEVAQSYGARVYQFEWCNDFAAARNQALSYVEGEWVLVLDADEVLKPEVVPEIKQAIQNSSYLVINLVRQEVGATQSPYSLVSRLFRYHPDIRFSRPYHAMVDDTVAQMLQREPQWQVVSLSQVGILHYGYSRDAIASRNKLTRALTAMEGYLASHPFDAYVCSKLGALYIQNNQVDQGVELLKRGLTSTKLEPAVLFELHYHLGNAYTRQGELNSGAIHYQQAIQQPILPQLKLGAYNNLGSLLLQAGELNHAKTAYEMAVKIDPSFALGHNNLGMTWKALGQMENAIASYQQAIQLNPEYGEAYQNLGVVWLKLGKVDQSLSAFKKAIALHETHNPAEAERLRQGLYAMGFQV
ncbi:MAG: tetratricopeptide repeat protein [Moorea sp. SIOASIH]|uniref:tetratricopeptide repeat protein n=1 Tax=Moorena sp. SIOASIH TaxID=2607817 RepID=UPI0013B8D906|nr:tetratricopeptide repeat protein [Moorena sp. SIOASIH]NEO42490.1 tetratricopeptide repeat protein [Moorena sp. SIOASIH]